MIKDTFMIFSFGKNIFIFALGFILCGCGLKVNEPSEPKAIAWVDNKGLYLNQILKDMPEGLNEADSTQYADNFVHNWVNDQLKAIEAKKLLGSEIEHIDRLVNNYRKSLLNFHLEQKWVEQKIDSISKNDNIEQYYQDNKDKFLVTTPLIKGTIVKVPKSYRQPKTLQKLMGSQKESDRMDFVDLCVKNNFDLYEFTTWTEFYDFISVLPTVKGTSYEYLLKKIRSVQQMSDTDNNYNIYISNFSPRGDQAPLESVKKEISRILFNQHKQNIINKAQEQLYNDALLQERVILPNQ